VAKGVGVRLVQVRVCPSHSQTSLRMGIMMGPIGTDMKSPIPPKSRILFLVVSVTMP
jgi:hypothetical protein